MYDSTIITINRDGIIQSVDKNCCKLFGYELEELIGQPLKILIPSPYKEQHDTYLETYNKTRIAKIIGKSRMVEGLHKNGTIFPIRLSVSKIGEGSDMLFIGMIDKIEDKAATITINTNGSVISCNQNVEDIFGIKANELIGNNVSIIMPSPHKENHDKYIKNYLQGGLPKVIGKFRNVAGKHKSGYVFPISLEVEHLHLGNISLFQGKIKKVDSMEAVFTIDEDGIIVSCNQNFVQPLFGYSSSELIGQDLNILIPDVHNVSGNTEIMEPLLKKTKFENPTKSWKTTGIHSMQLKHKDGSIFPVILEIFPFQNEDGKWLYSGRIKREEKIESTSSFCVQKIGDYFLRKIIGKGSYGEVRLAHHKDTKKNVAIKILQKNLMKGNELERARRESEIMKKLDHPNIIKLYEIIETDDLIHIIMEYAENTLFSYILEKKGLGETQSHDFFCQILSAIQYCHKLNIIHRDIKHQNILLTNNSQCKLIDFGLSNFVEEGQLRSTFCGTPAYAAPEMILGHKYNGPEVDVWSMGIVLFSMITGIFPFENVADIIHGNFIIPENISIECSDLLKKMLKVKPEERATLEEISKHPWVLFGPKMDSNLSNEGDIPSPNYIKIIDCKILSFPTTKNN